MTRPDVDDPTTNDRLRAGPDEPASPLTTAARDLLDARFTDLDADVAAGRPIGVSWEDVRARWASERR